MEVKDILKNRRIEKHLTLEEVGRMVGVSAATISRWESGEISNMKRDKIVNLANALDLSPSVIMGWEHEYKYDEPYVNASMVAEESVKYNASSNDNSENFNYYLNEDAREMAQFLFDNPDYKVLFDASRKVKKEDIEKVKRMIDLMNGDSDI